MKKSILLLAFSILIITGKITASTVSQSTARSIATNFFKLNVPAAANNPSLSLTLSYTQTETNGDVDFYIFNTAPMAGFVIVSGDNNAIPVIGYSAESAFRPNGPNQEIRVWMKSAAKRIHHIVANNLQADAMVQNLWTSYAAGQNPQASRSSAVGPLLTTTWNQNPYYNALCPPAATASTSNSKSVTGCVATAMAQIMKYWNYPRQGTGTNSYDDAPSGGYSQNYGTLTADFTRVLNWSAMPNAVTTNNSPVDSLMYELGVSVDMDYDPSGSGAFVLTAEAGGGPCSQTVYVNNFYYNPNTIQGVYLSSYTDADWITLMEGEINAGRVVQYEGDDATEGGHTWVMDGYQPQASGLDYLHMNWGWGGYEDGYFSVTNLQTPGFNPVDNDAALIGIEPLSPISLALTATNPNICPSGTGTTLTVAGGPATATYTWTPATGLSCTTCLAPIATPTSTTLYTVTADSAGVTGTATIAVTVVAPVRASFTFNATATCTLPENASFTNISTNATSYVWDFGDGTTGTQTNPIHPYAAAGTYTVKLYATNNCGVDSLVRSQAIQVSGGAPTAPSQNICNGQVATIAATGGVNDYWYSDAAGANILSSGNIYTTPNLAANTTYYVGTSITHAAISVGPATDGIGASSNYTATGIHGMIFNCTTAQVLNSVVVYAQTAGPRLFLLEDSNGTVLDSATITVAAGQQTVTLGFNIPAEDNLLLAISGAPNLIRNSAGAVFPYTSADGTVSITGNNLNAAGRFYFFYDWQLEQPSCATALTPVTVYVLSPSTGSFTATGTGTPVVSFTTTDTTASSYTWSFGDGTTSTAVNPTHTYATAGTYTVQLIVSNGTCADTTTRSITTTVLAGINDLTGFSALSIYPNPAKDVLTLSVTSAKEYEGCKLTLNNILGQTEYASDINLASGINTNNINVSGLASGVYFISLSNGKNVVTAKFIKD
jgi:PKD repeat protein